jgi:hypothetical protein
MVISEGVMIAAIAAVPACITGIAAVIAVVGTGGMAKKNHTAIKAVGDSLIQVKVQLDGRMEALINASKAQGRIDEQADVKRDQGCKYEQRGECHYPKDGSD